MKENTFYFSHDCDARLDEKIIQLRISHNWEGYGLYWALIEKLMGATDYVLSCDYNLLSFDFRVEEELIKAIVEDFNLFQFTDDREGFYSLSLLKRMELRREKSNKARASVNKRWDKYRKNKELDNQGDDTPVIQTYNDSNTSVIQGKERKEKKVSIEEFIGLFNSIRIEHKLISNIKSLSTEEADNFNSISELHSLEDFDLAIRNMMNNIWAKEKNILFPKHLLKIENFNRYLNEQPKEELSLGDKLMGKTI